MEPVAAAAFLLLGLLAFVGDGQGSFVHAVAAAAVLLLFAFWYRRPERIKPMRPSFVAAWGALFAYLAVRTVFSIDVGSSVGATMRYADALLIYFVFFQVSGSRAAKTVGRALVWFLFLLLVPAAVLSLVPPARQLVTPLHLLWSFDGHNHMNNIVLFALLPGTLFLSHRKFAHYAFIGFCLALLVLFRARIATVIALAGLMVFGARTLRVRLSGRRVFFAAAASLAVVAAVVLPPAISVNPGFRAKSSWNTRIEYWQQAARAIRGRPVFGYGPGTFALLSLRFQSAPRQSSWFAHNFFLEVAAETGLAGLLLVCWVLFESFVRPVASMVRKKRLPPAVSALAGAFLLVCINAFFDISLNLAVVWLVWWAVAGTIRAYET